MDKITHLNIFKDVLCKITSQCGSNKEMTFSEVTGLLLHATDLAKEDIKVKEAKRLLLPNQGAIRPSIKGRGIHNFVRDLLKEIE